jgi:hypothetical protein
MECEKMQMKMDFGELDKIQIGSIQVKVFKQS